MTTVFVEIGTSLFKNCSCIISHVWCSAISWRVVC